MKRESLPAFVANQWRRILIASLIGAAALQLDFPGPAPFAESAVAFAYAQSVVIALPFFAVVLTVGRLVHPEFVRCTETIAISALIFGLAGRIDLLNAVYPRGPVGVLLFFVLASGLHALLYSRLLDRFGGMTAGPLRKEVTFVCDRMSAWRALVPAPGHEADFFLHGTRFTFLPDSGDTEWVARAPDALHGQDLLRITRTAMVPGQTFRMVIRALRAGSGADAGACEIALSFRDSAPGEVTVVIEAMMRNMPARYALDMALGPSLSSQLRRIRRHLETERPRRVSHAALAERDLRV